MLLRTANLLLTESFHGNIQKVERAKEERKQPLAFKKIRWTQELGEKVIRSQIIRSQIAGAKEELRPEAGA